MLKGGVDAGTWLWRLAAFDVQCLKAFGLGRVEEPLDKIRRAECDLFL